MNCAFVFFDSVNVRGAGLPMEMFARSNRRAVDFGTVGVIRVKGHKVRAGPRLTPNLAVHLWNLRESEEGRKNVCLSSPSVFMLHFCCQRMT